MNGAPVSAPMAPTNRRPPAPRLASLRPKCSASSAWASALNRSVMASSSRSLSVNRPGLALPAFEITRPMSRSRVASANPEMNPSSERSATTTRCLIPKSRESWVPSASSKACRRATSTTLMCEAAIWRANSRPIAVERYEQDAGCFARKALTNEPTAELAIRRLLLDAAKSFTDPKNPKGCLIVLGATNCAIESTDIFEALAERRRTAEKAVRARIATGQKAGELSDNADVDALTGMVTATLYGLAIKARDGAPRARLRTIVEQLMMMWPRRA